jgi:hypothetical protein
MPDLNDLLTFDWKHLALLVLAALITGVWNLCVAKKTQIDEWSESKPRIAGALKIVRGLGLDPWVIWQGVVLIALGRLPNYTKQSLDDLNGGTIKPPSKPKPPILPLLMVGVLLGLMVWFCGCQRETVPPCDYAQLQVDKAKCVLESEQCADAGLTADTCPTVKPCRELFLKDCSK